MIGSKKAKKEEVERAALETAVNEIAKEVGNLARAAVEGKLDARIDVNKFDGEFRTIAEGFNDTLDAVVGPLNVAAEYVDRISKGDIPEKITDEYKGDFNEVKNNLNLCIGVLNDLVADTQGLAQAGAEGKLDARADASKFAGDFGKLVQGLNDLMDAVVGPINVTAEYVDRISKGDIPEKITDEYKGDFNEVKNNLNLCIDTLRGLIEEDGGAALQAAANKDFTKRVQRQYGGLFDQMKKNINMMLDNIHNAMTQVADAVEQVSSASGQISTGSQSLAEGANEQASSLEEISSSLEQMTSMTKQNADNAGQAKNLAAGARDSADQGSDSMKRMSDAIDMIKKSSDETAKIIKTIDEIAFQTNLLALNAAVEAARAGEAGKGFAVVAEEVRNLAQRSAEAAKNTSEMIEESVKNSDNGVKISEEVGKAFVGIVENIGKVNDLVGEIAAASNEQAQGIEQINTAVAELDKVTQQNAANSEESASAAEQLSSQANELSSMVEGFVLSNNGNGGSRRGELTAGQIQGSMQVRAHDHGGNGDKTVVQKSKKGKKTKRHHDQGIEAQAKVVRPEEIIPLDDEELKEF
ncbi:MAG: HAMP domain-containing protein [Deltaproteobacteria bacterium]|nr:HAMP domain-containing protein [Deltaproteobacteria bacterium]